MVGSPRPPPLDSYSLAVPHKGWFLKFAPILRFSHAQLGQRLAVLNAISELIVMQLLEYRTQLLGVCKSGVCASKQVPVQMALSLALCVAFSVP